MKFVKPPPLRFALTFLFTFGEVAMSRANNGKIIRKSQTANQFYVLNVVDPGLIGIERAF